MVHEITINMVHEITINMVHEITINTERLPPCIRLYILHTMQYAQVQIPVIQQGSINRLKEIISTLSEYTRKQISSTLIELLFSCSWWVPNHLFCKFVFTDFQITPPPPPQPPESNPLNTVLLFAWQRELRSDMFHSRWKSVQNKRPFVGILATHWHWQGYCHQEKTRLHFLFLLVCLFCKCLWTKWPIKTQHKFWPSWHPLHQLLPLQGTPPETKINPCMCVWVQGCAEDLDRLFFFEGGGGAFKDHLVPLPSFSHRDSPHTHTHYTRCSRTCNTDHNTLRGFLKSCGLHFSKVLRVSLTMLARETMITSMALTGSMGMKSPIKLRRFTSSMAFCITMQVRSMLPAFLKTQYRQG